MFLNQFVNNASINFGLDLRIIEWKTRIVVLIALTPSSNIKHILS